MKVGDQAGLGGQMEGQRPFINCVTSFMKAPVAEKHVYDDTQIWDFSNSPPLPLPVHTKIILLQYRYTVSL